MLGRLRAGGLAVLAGALAACAEAPRAGPNVVLVVLDTTRADALSCYGGPPGTTPALDALAERGVRFERAFATDFWTLPSHASLLTGLYPREASATSETNVLPASVATIAEELSAAGWSTAGVVSNPWLTAERGFAQGFDLWLEAWRDDVRPAPLATEPQIEGEAVRRAGAWVEARSRDAAPFFLFVNLNVAHLPYAPPPRWRRGRLDETEDVVARLPRLMRVSGMWKHYAGELELDEEDLRILRALYHSEVAIADDLVRRLLESLAGAGIDDETLVIVTSDHGENIGDHGLIDHVLSMHDTTLHVPLIVRAPRDDGTRPDAGTRWDALSERADALVSLVDVAGAVRHACGLAHDATRCLFPHGPPREAVFAENERPLHAVELLRASYPHVDAGAIDHPQRVVRTGEDKLVVHEGAGTTWFEVGATAADERERQAPDGEARRALGARLAEWSRSLRPPAPLAEQAPSADDESLERLRELGYVR